MACRLDEEGIAHKGLSDVVVGLMAEIQDRVRVRTTSVRNAYLSPLALLRSSTPYSVLPLSVAAERRVLSHCLCHAPQGIEWVCDNT